MFRKITIHTATDRRCYHGACCSDLQKEVNSKADAKKYLKSLGLSVTYFPVEQQYMGFKEHRVITKFCHSFEEAANLAIAYLTQEDSCEKEETDVDQKS